MAVAPWKRACELLYGVDNSILYAILSLEALSIYITYTEARSFGRWWLLQGQSGAAAFILRFQLQLFNKASPEIVHLRFQRNRPELVEGSTSTIALIFAHAT
ncbi:hypothetical protein A2635_00510 [Candidatus Peribacteria bacterium RIFCSPHIGHO2_01_FULL_51_9]|nr:MAG: hypothetical protein A2635_00510 [Candidatus Peribacteria bacterium RIFCSPHIGHO2_01_FULL_51_9]